MNDSDHVDYVCPADHGGMDCPVEDVGACMVCFAYAAAWPDECPGEGMTSEQSSAVYAGTLNYRDGQWREECCVVQRTAEDVVDRQAVRATSQAEVNRETD